jgi:uncharacterized protein YgiM (DUF1202 family)
MRIGTSGLGGRSLFIVIFVMLVSACASPISIGPAATEVAVIETIAAEAETAMPEEVVTPTDVPPTPTVVVEPTAVPTVQCTVKNVVGLNLRAGPGTEFASVAKLEAAEVLAASGRSTEGDWVAIARSDGVQGWVNSNYVDCGDAIPQLPEATPATAP